MILTGPSDPRTLSITKILKAEIELNWLPPTEPNGEVHYVIYYTPEGAREQSIDTGSNLTHYNLTGLERNRVYTNISVQALNTAGGSQRSAIIAQYNHMPDVGELFARKEHPTYNSSRHVFCRNKELPAYSVLCGLCDAYACIKMLTVCVHIV